VERSVSLPARLFPFFAFFALSCGSPYAQLYPTLVDGKYDSEFPYRGCSGQLEEIGESVKMVNCIAYYRTFLVSREEHITAADLTPAFFAARKHESAIQTSQGSGTATIIHAENRRLVLLTCAHVVGYPDTVVSYYFTADHHPSEFVRSVAIKEKQSTYVAVLPEGGELEVLALDKNIDVALLGKTLDVEPFPAVPRFTYPAGRAKELEWGSFVYLFGYPSGYRMVTKGIVSSPNKDRRGTFLVDAVFNRGFSGGIALGVRDGVPNFELVGIVKLVSGHPDYVLTPAPADGVPEYDPGVPYTGTAFVEKRMDIEYGIVQAISMETIGEFIASVRDKLAARGYPLRFPSTNVVP
jgi:hypothetical protein